MQNTYGETALMSAAKAGNVEGVQLLLDKGATVNAADSFGRTALMYAAQNLQPGLLRLLLARGADAAAKQQDGRRALDCAAQALDKAEKAEVIRILKEADTKR